MDHQVDQSKPPKELDKVTPFPYLFVLCVEGLSANLSRANESNLIWGIKIIKKNPFISHLLFADDYYIFLSSIKRRRVMQSKTY